MTAILQLTVAKPILLLGKISSNLRPLAAALENFGPFDFSEGPTGPLYASDERRLV